MLDLEAVADRVADRLIGQCMVSLDEALADEGFPTYEAIPDKLHSLVDGLVFCCNDCGWYCSTEELNNDDGTERCDDCNA